MAINNESQLVLYEVHCISLAHSLHLLSNINRCVYLSCYRVLFRLSKHTIDVLHCDLLSVSRLPLCSFRFFHSYQKLKNASLNFYVYDSLCFVLCTIFHSFIPIFTFFILTRLVLFADNNIEIELKLYKVMHTNEIE